MGGDGRERGGRAQRRGEEWRATGFKDVRRPRERKPGGRSERNGGKEEEEEA